MNRLARERSPYLLQHATNPVDWFSWGEEAFSKARSEDKPIFLSIGYSTCHWCHVMEHESFEDDRIAAVLNGHYVSIKVDREERPDVDRVYMTFVQASTGSGGWPMSVWLTPELKPFYGGTYFPPTSKWGRPGFVDILQDIARVWTTERGRVTESADTLTARLRTIEKAAPTWTVPEASALRRTVDQFRQSFDARHGGFGDAPKFPRPSELLFLLREHARAAGSPGNPDAGEPGSDDHQARDMVLRTLRAMAAGGMRDQIGGGFHRYSVDAEWRVPHFEKMLYDQAQLVLAFVEGAQVSGDSFFMEIAEDTARYVIRDMSDPEGGFHSAEDADSLEPDDHSGAAPSEGHASARKKEGAYYLWRADEIDTLLGTDAGVVKLRYGIEPGGNAPQDPQQEFTGKNLLYVARSIDDLAKETRESRDEIEAIVNRARETMFEERSKRPKPGRDDKVLTAWNGLMIAALARLARALPIESAVPYVDAASRAAAFLRTRMWDAQSRTLLRRFRGGHAEIPGYAEDYAYLIFGLLELFQVEGDVAWLEWAIALQRRQDELFWDDDGGGWFSTDGRDPSVLLRMKEDYDGAEPAPSSVSVLNLLWLSHLVEDTVWRERVERTLRAFGSTLEKMGRAVPMMAAALSTYLAGVQQIVIVHPTTQPPRSGSDEPRATTADLDRLVALRYLPFAIVLRLTPDRQSALGSALPFIAAMQPIDGVAAAYICRDFACRRPVTTAHALEAEIADIGVGL